MSRHCNQQLSRRGAIAVLAAILLIPALVVVAFAINLGYILVAKQEMQKAADSAALAGASQILVAQPSGNPYNGARASSDMAKAVSEAKMFSVANTARGVNLTLLDSDVVVGHVAAPTDPSSPLTPWSSGQPYPNAVKVVVRRDSTANTPLSLFLANIMGTSTWSGQATATACASRSYNVTGFKSSTINAPLLPVAIKLADWNNFLNTGKSPDNAVHDNFTATSSNVANGSDKIPEFEDARPDWICIGPPSSDANTLRNWIDYGSSPSDLAYFGPQGMQAATSSPEVPGTKSTETKNLQNAIGQSRVVPLYSSCDGKNYVLAGFAGVVIVDASGNGANLRIRFQPMTVYTTTATSSGEAWSGTNPFVYPTSPLALIR